MSVTGRDDAHSEPPALLTRLPGRARPRPQALEEFEESAKALRRRFDPVVWPIFVPRAEDMYRWRVQLECGCVQEIFMRGDDGYPDERRWLGPITQYRLPAGEVWCSNDHGEPVQVYRDVVEWVERRVEEFPPDPEEPPDEGMDAETWAKIRNAEPHSSAFWRVRLSCGHYCDHVVTDVDWKPEDGPTLVTEERVAQMRRKLEAMWSAEGHSGWPEEGPERDHVRKMLDLRWPRPEPERDCRACQYARRITGYQRVGWLVPKSKPKAPPAPDAERKRAEARLAKVEAEAERLREQLGLSEDE